MKNLLIILLAFSVNLVFGQKESTFNFVIETTEDKTEYKFLVDDAVDFEVDWGNDNSDTYDGNVEPTHDFGEAGSWTIQVNGEASRIRFWTGSGCEYAQMLQDILTPVSDGITGITSALNMLRGTTVESFTAADFFDDASANVTDMRGMFHDSDFNQDIGGWDVSNVTTMALLFRGTSFNQDISGWDVSNVTSMFGLFQHSEFNQDIGVWDVSNVTDMNSMFSGSNFNQDIGSWDVSNVTEMRDMFRNSDFNQDIDDWNVSNVSNMMYLFAYSAFNKPISSWDVSNVTLMDYMFRDSEFNQDIGGWDVSSVTNMQGMFYLSDFNQDISKWDVSNVENFSSFLFRSELSTENYNKLLIKWSELDLHQDIRFHGGSSKYDLGLPEDRRQYIINEFGWTFTDGGNTGNEVFLLTLYANPQYAGEVEGEGLYYSDDNVDVKAFANMGYEFANWTDGDSEEVDTEAEFVFVMPAEAVSLTANFSHIDYQLTLDIYPEGAGSVSGEGTYIMDQEVTLAATPNEGYEFINWSNGEDVLSDDETYIFTMPAEDVIITANFSEITTIMEETLFAQNISMFPNPAQNYLSIEGLGKNSTISVFSINGAKMLRLHNQSGRVNLDVSGFNNGMYIIKISSDRTIISKKILIKNHY